MLYQMYQMREDMLAWPNMLARVGSRAMWQAGGYTEPVSGAFARSIGAVCDMLAGTALSHERPRFGITEVQSGNGLAAITEEITDTTPFCDLVHFRADRPVARPRVLVVAPMSGHFATLLRGTVQVLLRDHDVWITDWRDARAIPVADGAFGLDEFIDHIIRFLEVIGPGGHVVAVCQPTVAVLAAVAVMSQAGNTAVPRSMTLMAGPIDTRINPTKVNDLATSHPMSWFEGKLIGTVPSRYAGAGRRVYPGFMQLAAFVSMNLERHISAHMTQYRNLLFGRIEPARVHRAFYDEYNAVMDLPAEFYLDTIRRVFQDHDLPEGRLTWHGERVDPLAIRRTAILTVEGEKDDICSIGQTVAALDICARVKPARKRHHLQTGVGHYGVFNGRRWANEIYPLVREMIEGMN